MDSYAAPALPIVQRLTEAAGRAPEALPNGPLPWAGGETR